MCQLSGWHIIGLRGGFFPVDAWHAINLGFTISDQDARQPP
jgi:hypothetical protein